MLGLVRLLVVVQSRERRSLDYHQVQKVSILVPGLKIFPFENLKYRGKLWNKASVLVLDSLDTWSLL